MQYIEAIATGIKCDNPLCDFSDDTVKEGEYEQWLNKPCPKCGENLLTEEDYKTFKFMLAVTNEFNNLKPEELVELCKSVDVEAVKGDEVFAGAKGLENLDGDQTVIVTLDTHKGIKVTDIRKSE